MLYLYVSFPINGLTEQFKRYECVDVIEHNLPQSYITIRLKLSLRRGFSECYTQYDIFIELFHHLWKNW